MNISYHPVLMDSPQIIRSPDRTPLKRVGRAIKTKVHLIPRSVEGSGELHVFFVFVAFPRSVNIAPQIMHLCRIIDLKTLKRSGVWSDLG